MLGGRAWGVRDVDWNRRVVWVEPVDEPGKSRWSGAGRALSWEVCQSIREVLCGDDRLAPHLSNRAATKLAELHEEYDWARVDGTTLFRDAVRSRSRWWTFGGARANRTLAHALDKAGVATMAVDDLSIGLRSPAPVDAIKAIADATDPATLRMPVDPRRVDAIKFASCVPDAALRRMISERDADEPADEPGPERTDAHRKQLAPAFPLSRHSRYGQAPGQGSSPTQSPVEVSSGSRSSRRSPWPRMVVPL